ncbi:MAG: RimK family alpha-L-glutamate ligase [Saprospiraceae bacterium]
MRILLLSRNPALYSTNSIAVAARRKGHYVRIVDHVNCDLIVDNKKNIVLYHGEHISGYDVVIPRIGSSVTSYGSMVVRHFESMGIFCTLTSDALIKTRDKLSCLQILSNSYLPVPKTAITNNYYSFPNIIKYIGKFPMIIKLLQGTHGLGVIKADNYKISESIMEAFFKTKQKVLLQEFIAESSGEDVRAFVVGNKVVAAMMRKAKPGEFRSNLHRGATSQKIQLTDEEENVALKATKTMGLNIAGVDMLRSSRGPLIMEVNASPGLEGIETTTKINIAKEIIEFVEKTYKKASL